MKSDAAFMIPVFSHTVENWSDYKEEMIDMLDLEDGDGHKTDYFKYHQEGKLPPYAERLFDIRRNRLNSLKDKYKVIGDVRGQGLFLGIEIIHKKDKKPNAKLAKHIKNKLRDKHILVGTDGPYNNVIKTKPPICFTMKNVDQVIISLIKILDRYQ